MTVDQKAEVTDADDTDTNPDESTPDDTTQEATATETATAESAGETADAPTEPPADNGGGILTALRSNLLPILLAVALVVAAGLTAWLYMFQFRADQATDAQAAETVVQAATEGTVALLSYSPESFADDFATAKTHLTGDFLSYYSEFTDEIVTPAVQDKQVETSAAVVRAAVSDLEPDSAVVLVFVNQMTTSAENPDGTFAASAVKVGMQKVDGSWLIEAFDPV